MELHSIIFLVTILSVIFLVTFYIHSKQKRKLFLSQDKQEPRFDLVNQKTPSGTPQNYKEEFEEDVIAEDEDIEEENLFTDDPLMQPKEKPPTEAKKIALAPEELLFIMLAAKPDRPYAGYELLQSLLSAGLRFGAMDLFHRYEDLNGKGKVLFSVASASETGTFEINKMGAYSAKGLMFFMRLSHQKDLLLAFDAMVETARQLVEDLGGEILDDERRVLSNDKIEKMRKRIVEFEQKQLIGDLFDQ